MINDKNKNDISFFEILRKIVPMAFKACPIYVIVSNGVGILHGLSHGFSVYMTQKFFDSVADFIKVTGGFGKIILMAAALAVALILCRILNGIDNFMYNNKENLIIGYMGKKINEKAGKLDPIVFDDTKYLDDIKKAQEGAANSAELLSGLTSIFTVYLFYFLFMAVYLYRLRPILAVSIILIFIPTVFNQIMRVKTFSELADESAPIRREYEYYERCMGDREYYKETRLLGAFGYFKDLYLSSLKMLNKKIWKAQKKSILMELSMKMITLLGYMGVLYLLFDSLLKEDISVGAFGAVFSSMGFMISVMEEMIYGHIGIITQNMGTVKNLIRFFEIPERTGKDIIVDKVPDISVKNVSFSYPGTKSSSLSDINLKVKSGETIAIVGENGAGKTTLVKLMLGIYIPTEGNVFIGGVDTSEASFGTLYGNTSAVFQKYQKYQMTLKENISISSLENGSQESYEAEQKALKEAALKADLEVNEEKFPKGYETMLSREFEGVDLSGGQWQRIAIARGFYRIHNMIVLDEPTAAIDPVEETKIYRKFAEMSEGNTAIIVTHRLGSAKIADRIVVMDKGRIVEIGNHEELINKNGKYAEMFEAQSKWYVKEENLAQV